MQTCILALDQGTTSSRAILFDRSGRELAKAQKQFTQSYPRPGWVEHDPQEIWGTQLAAAVPGLGEDFTFRVAAVDDKSGCGVESGPYSSRPLPPK